MYGNGRGPRGGEVLSPNSGMQLCRIRVSPCGHQNRKGHVPVFNTGATARNCAIRPDGVFTYSPESEPYCYPTRTLCWSCSPFPHIVNTSFFFPIMSSTGQATFSSSVQSIIEAALDDYTKITGIDLSKTPFAAALENSNSLEAVLQLLHERENAFTEYREGNRRLTNCLNPAVKVIQAFSGIIGEAVIVSPAPAYPSGDFLTATSSGPLPTIKCVVCCHRHSPCRTSLQHAFQSVPL